MFFFFNRFPVKVEIWERRANGWFVHLDKGRRLRYKDGKWEYQLKKAKELTKPVSPEFIYFDSKGKNRLKLFSPIPGVYQPMKVMVKKDEKGNEIADMKIMNEDTRRYLVMKSQDIVNKYQTQKGFLEKYGAIVAVIPFIIFSLVMFMLFNGYLEHMTQAAGQIIASMEKILSTLNTANLGPLL